jgi:sporulation protein YlmC with PRC-barrel domain
VRRYSSFPGRMVVTEGGRELGKCRDLRATLGRGRPSVDAVVVGRRGWLEHFGISRPAGHRKDAVPWDAVVRIEGGRIVVRDGTELE